MKCYVGIDVGKDTLAVAIPKNNGKYKNKTVSNDEAGIAKLIEELQPHDCHCTVEATGVYGRLVAFMLYDAGIDVSVINPKQYKYFASMMLQTTKTDAIDAAILSSYGERMQPPLFTPPSRKVLEIKQKIALINQLRKNHAAIRNLSMSMGHDVVRDESTKSRTALIMEMLEVQIKGIEDEIFDATQEEFEKAMDLATSVVGIGKKTASSIIMATNAFTSFESAKQVSKFLGLAPVYRQSGTSVDYNAGINRSGAPYIRAQLYICTWSAIRYNNACRQMYERLKGNGKPSKVALIAVANKLIRQLFAVVKSGIPFDNNYAEKQQTAH